jgi:hypothetical protein
MTFGVSEFAVGIVFGRGEKMLFANNKRSSCPLAGNLMQQKKNNMKKNLRVIIQLT